MKIFQDAKDKYVTGVVFYGNSTTKKLYNDVAMTEAAKVDDIADAFVKGVALVLLPDASMHRPTAITAEGALVIGSDEYSAPTE